MFKDIMEIMISPIIVFLWLKFMIALLEWKPKQSNSDQLGTLLEKWKQDYKYKETTITTYKDGEPINKDKYRRKPPKRKGAKYY